MAVEAPITLKEVQLRLGVAQHVLIHLCEKGVIEPDFAETSGRGKRREFSRRKRKGMRAAVYARFSSENQREQSIQDQIRVCKEFAKPDGITVLEDHIYFDEAQSGSIRSRPGLEALKKAAEDKLFDVVLVACADCPSDLLFPANAPLPLRPPCPPTSCPMPLPANPAPSQPLDGPVNPPAPPLRGRKVRTLEGTP